MGRLVMAKPEDGCVGEGGNLDNARAISGNIMVVKRGKCMFPDKVLMCFVLSTCVQDAIRCPACTRMCVALALLAQCPDLGRSNRPGYRRCNRQFGQVDRPAGYSSRVQRRVAEDTYLQRLSGVLVSDAQVLRRECSVRPTGPF